MLLFAAGASVRSVGLFSEYGKRFSSTVLNQKSSSTVSTWRYGPVSNWEFNSSVLGRQFSSSLSDRTYFLERIGLKEEDIVWPDKVESDDIKADHWKQNPNSIRAMYGASDLSKLPVFEGGYINFGYWPDLKDLRLDKQGRVEASERMYQEITKMASLHSEEVAAVDVGCGMGFGCGYMMKRYFPDQLVGLDVTPEQIERANEQQASILSLCPPERFKFIVGSATAMPFENNSFSHVVSVEAAQHFDSIEKFIQESRRILQPSGQLVFATFFATNPEGRSAIKALIPDYATYCSDRTIGDVMTSLTESFQETEVKSIGSKVFPGLAQWLKTIGYENQWQILWPALYKANFIDYFVLKGKATEFYQSTEEKLENPQPPRLH